MANYSTTNDLKKGVLHRCGELTDGTSTYDSKALEYINSLYQSIIAGGNEFDIELGEPWVWAKSANPGVLILNAPYGTGTVTVTNNSTSITFSSAPSSSQAGNYLKIVGRPEFFRIATHTAATTAATLDAVYTDDSSGGLSFQSIQLDYQLASGIARLIGPMHVYRSQDSVDNTGEITGCDLSTLARQYPLHLLQNGTPTAFAQTAKTSAGVITVRFNRVVATTTRVEYDYIPSVSDLTASPDLTPIVPKEFRVALEYGATYMLMIDKNDQRASEYATLTKAKLMAMVGANRRESSHVGVNKGRLIARPDLMARRFVTQETQ